MKNSNCGMARECQGGQQQSVFCGNGFAERLRPKTHSRVIHRKHGYLRGSTSGKSRRPKNGEKKSARGRAVGKIAGKKVGAAMTVGEGGST